MKRLSLAFLLACGLALPAMALEDLPEPAAAKVALAPPPIMLKPQATVEGDVVTLGDLFDNLDPAKSKSPVTYAPKPGQRITLDANWLYTVARAQSLAWRPLSPYDRVNLERPGQTVPREMIENALMAALEAHGVSSDHAIELSNRNLQISISTEARPAVAVRDLTYDERSRRFMATIDVPAGSPNAQRVKLNGRVYTVVEIPVPARNIAKDEKIAERDLKWIQINTDQLRDEIIADASQLIGKTPRRMLRPGQPITQQDVQRPILVSKNSLVVMVVNSGSMTITAQGKAIEDGGQGDTVRVLNMQSNTTIEAVVNGAGTVSVKPQNRVLVN